MKSDTVCVCAIFMRKCLPGHLNKLFDIIYNSNFVLFYSTYFQFIAAFGFSDINFTKAKCIIYYYYYYYFYLYRSVDVLWFMFYAILFYHWKYFCISLKLNFIIQKFVFYLYGLIV